MDTDASLAQPDAFADLKQRIIEDFRAWLDELGETDIEELGCQAAAAPPSPPSLHTLLGELTALRQDARLQARTSQNAARQIEELGQKLESGLAQAGNQLGQAANAAKSLVPETRREAQRAIALELIALVEGLARCQTALRQLDLPRLALGKRRNALRQRISQPVDLLLAKGLDSLHHLHLTPIAQPGIPFDPACMRAVGTREDSDVPPGHVADVIRQGYRIGPELLQTAEVKVKSP